MALKELFNQPLTTSPDDNDRIALGQPSIAGGKNILWSALKNFLQTAIRKIVDTDGDTVIGTELTADADYGYTKSPKVDGDLSNGILHEFLDGADETMFRVKTDGITKFETPLNDDYMWIGNATDLPTEIATNEVLIDTASLILGVHTVIDARITTSSKVLFSFSNVGQLLGTVKYTLSAGQCVFTSSDLTDTATFTYQIYF